MPAPLNDAKRRKLAQDKAKWQNRAANTKPATENKGGPAPKENDGKDSEQQQKDGETETTEEKDDDDEESAASKESGR